MAGAKPLPVVGANSTQADAHAGHDHAGHDHAGHDHTYDDHDHAHGGGGQDGHDHGAHGHDHGSELREMAVQNRKRLMFVAFAGTLVMVAEIAGGLAANSLVLMADAGHYATDVGAVLLAFLAVSWALRPADKRRTYGHQRAEVIAAFVNALVLWGISIYFLWEAYVRITNPPEVHGPIVMVIGGLTLLTNAGLAFVLHAGSGHNINVRAAYVHILSDVLGSAAALVAGVLVYYKGWHVADPILTVFITVLILVFTWRLTRQTLHILMQGTPDTVDADAVARDLRRMPNVKDIHDLHIWHIGTGLDALTVHVNLKGPRQNDDLSYDIARHLRDTYKIRHVTVQVEDPSGQCDSASCGWPAA
jgi:cobalt-zinc-cadmium efflux system protein